MKTLQTSFNQTANEKDEELLKYKNDFNQQQILIENLNDELKTKTNEIQQISQEKNISNERHLALEEKFNNILAERAGLENQLDTIRVQMQTTESTIKKKKQDETVKLEQSEEKIKQLQVGSLKYCIGKLILTGIKLEWQNSS